MGLAQGPQFNQCAITRAHSFFSRGRPRISSQQSPNSHVSTQQCVCMRASPAPSLLRQPKQNTTVCKIFSLTVSETAWDLQTVMHIGIQWKCPRDGWGDFKVVLKSSLGTAGTWFYLGSRILNILNYHTASKCLPEFMWQRLHESGIGWLLCSIVWLIFSSWKGSTFILSRICAYNKEFRGVDLRLIK